jgi:hypothetical protein
VSCRVVSYRHVAWPLTCYSVSLFYKWYPFSSTLLGSYQCTMWSRPEIEDQFIAWLTSLQNTKRTRENVYDSITIWISDISVQRAHYVANGGVEVLKHKSELNVIR